MEQKQNKKGISLSVIVWNMSLIPLCDSELSGEIFIGKKFLVISFQGL